LPLTCRSRPMPACRSRGSPLTGPYERPGRSGTHPRREPAPGSAAVSDDPAVLVHGSVEPLGRIPGISSYEANDRLDRTTGFARTVAGLGSGALRGRDLIRRSAAMNSHRTDSARRSGFDGARSEKGVRSQLFGTHIASAKYETSRKRQRRNDFSALGLRMVKTPVFGSVRIRTSSLSAGLSCVTLSVADASGSLAQACRVLELQPSRRTGVGSGLFLRPCGNQPDLPDLAKKRPDPFSGSVTESRSARRERKGMRTSLAID